MVKTTKKSSKKKGFRKTALSTSENTVKEKAPKKKTSKKKMVNKTAVRNLTNRNNAKLVEKLAGAKSKSAVIRMERFYPTKMTLAQKHVLEEIKTERRIYQGAVKKMDLNKEELTRILNLGQASQSAINRIHDKMAGTRAYSQNDLVVIQLLLLMHLNGMDVKKISYNKALKTSLPKTSLSKTDLIAAARTNQKLSKSDKEGLDQLLLQEQFYTSKMSSTDLSIWELAYIVFLGNQNKSAYNRIRDKMSGQRPYSVLDLVIARCLELAHKAGIELDKIEYDKNGRMIQPKVAEQ